MKGNATESARHKVFAKKMNFGCGRKTGVN